MTKEQLDNVATLTHIIIEVEKHMHILKCDMVFKGTSVLEKYLEKLEAKLSENLD